MSTRPLSILLLTGALLGCSERPQNFAQSDRHIEDRDQTARYDGQRQRTLGQNESARIYNEGALR